MIQLIYTPYSVCKSDDDFHTSVIYGSILLQ